jgi:hypothetical protein
MLGEQPMLKSLRRRLRHPDMNHGPTLVQAVLTSKSIQLSQSRHSHVLRIGILKGFLGRQLSIRSLHRLTHHHELDAEHDRHEAPPLTYHTARHANKAPC